MTAIFMSFSRNGKRSRKRKTEITGKYNRKALSDGWIEQARHDCPILRIGVMHEQPVSERENLWMGSSSLSSTVSSCTTKPLSSTCRG